MPRRSTRDFDAGKLDRVVQSIIVPQVIEFAWVINEQRRIRSRRLNIIDDRVILSAEGHRAVRACKADVGLTSKHCAALPQSARERRKAALQFEHRLIAAAQILNTRQAPTVSLKKPGLSRVQMGAITVIHI
jgi:hypothetical protein